MELSLTVLSDFRQASVAKALEKFIRLMKMKLKSDLSDVTRAGCHEKRYFVA